jgi:hypothetical protein
MVSPITKIMSLTHLGRHGGPAINFHKMIFVILFKILSIYLYSC